MIKELIKKHGKQKINTLTKYPSILTLHRLGEKGKLTDAVTTDLVGEAMFATEKIDGTNVRLIYFGDEYLIGSREFILHHNHDLYFDQAQGIVEALRALNLQAPKNESNQLTVIYGELFGGRISANSKQYGTDKIGFRVFDIAIYPDLLILDRNIDEISRWRERETESGIRYGQNFLSRDELAKWGNIYDLVPAISFELGDMSHTTILENLRNFIPQTNVALSQAAQMKPEGVILRNNDRSKIVKLRYEDYERTLNSQK